jgi:hypothetical protein
VTSTTGPRPIYRNVLVDSTRWDAIELRDDDIIISTPAKCGTTWMQTCVALLVFQTPELPAPLAELSPWVDMLTWPLDELVALLDAQEHRRFLKTHTPLDGLPWNPKVTYVGVGRDPRDVALSWDDHMANMDMGALFTARVNAVGMDDLEPAMLPPVPPDDPVDRFWAWVDISADDDCMVGLENAVRHLAGFWERRDEPNIALFHYADMKADLDGTMRRLADVLGIDVPAERWDGLVHAATFEQMKQHADRLAPDTTHGIWQDNTKFFREGRSGRWRDVVADADLDRYFARVRDLGLDPDLVEWLHR